MGGDADIANTGKQWHSRVFFPYVLSGKPGRLYPDCKFAMETFHLLSILAARGYFLTEMDKKSVFSNQVDEQIVLQLNRLNNTGA